MVELQSITIDADVLKLIPKATAAELSVLPLRIENGVVVVAVSEKYERQLVSDLEFYLGKKVKPELVPAKDLQEALQRYYDISTIEMKKATEAAPEFLSVREEERQTDSSTDGSVVTLVNRLISDAIKMGCKRYSHRAVRTAYACSLSYRRSAA